MGFNPFMTQKGIIHPSQLYGPSVSALGLYYIYITISEKMYQRIEKMLKQEVCSAHNHARLSPLTPRNRALSPSGS
ncbi:protein of unknown function [Paenibacillus alvei]|uniref:Uncharacterized protein n=1 Tax=Paenibacillus alvei TaxID=44250 RepID=A0A383R9U3_PAEAL|nr:protein of unknown function [Paenibacillus alvei]